MLAAECYKSRLADGLTAFEFTYMLLQAYDFLHLYKKYNCRLQLGGNDQWSNIIAGAELIRKKEGKQAYGLTFNLLTAGDGSKMGKSAGNAIWLDAAKTSPYDFFQYWRNVDDQTVVKLLKLLTFLPLEEIEVMAKWQGKELNKAKETLAFEVTKIVHGEDEAKKALEASKALFAGGGDLENMPTTEISIESINKGINIIELLDFVKIIPSRSEGRRLIKDGAIKLNNKKIESFEYIVNKNDFVDGFIKIQKGKKIFLRVGFGYIPDDYEIGKKV